MYSPSIYNVCMFDIQKGKHPNFGPDAILIQIADPPGDFVEPAATFSEVYKFQFLDLEAEDEAIDEEMKIMPYQAKEIAAILRRALVSNANVVVQCTMGVARSGAVVEAAIQMGFNDPGTYRHPNILVKHSILRAANLPVDQTEKRDA